MKDVLAKASIIAEQSAAGLNEPTSHGKAGSKPPVIAGESTYDTIKGRFERCRSDKERLWAVEWAEKLLSDTKKQKRKGGMTTEEYRFWIVQEYEGKHWEDAAHMAGVSPSYVRKIRQDYGRRPSDGLPEEKAA